MNPTNPQRRQHLLTAAALGGLAAAPAQAVAVVAAEAPVQAQKF